MKNALAMLPFFLFTFAVISFADTDADVVKDVSGDVVLTGEDYHIYSPTFAGITLERIDAVLSDIMFASPIVMFPTYVGNPAVLLNADLIFKFNVTVPNGQSTRWDTRLDAWGRREVISTVDRENAWFRIAYHNKEQNLYKLLCCPINPLHPSFPCTDVGYAFIRGVLHLVPDNGQSLPVVFRRVNGPNRYISTVA